MSSTRSLAMAPARFLAPALAFVAGADRIVAQEEPAAVEPTATASAPPLWSDYRGPTVTGRAPADAAVPLRWGEDRNVTWKTAIPGEGWSTPVVGDGRIWLTTATRDGKQLSVVAVDLPSGRILRDQVVFEVERPESKNKLNSYASPSPLTDGTHVWVHFGTYGTACLDAESGETVWERRDIRCDHMEGPGSSPFLWRDQLILTMDGGDVQYVTALDKATGETIWKTDRTVDFEGVPPDLRKGYSTPLVIEVDGRERLLSSGARATCAYDPATGEELWKVRHPGFSMSSRALWDGEIVYLNTGFMRAELHAVRTSGDGDVTADNVVWTYRRGVPTMASPILDGDRIYLVNDSGVVSCIDKATGKRVWNHRVGGSHCASPILAAGRLYFFDREGRTVVLAPGEDGPEELAVNELEAGFMASPVVVGNAFLLRTRTHLYRVETPD